MHLLTRFNGSAVNKFLTDEVLLTFLWFNFTDVFLSRRTTSKHTHEVILVQIKEGNNVNRHGLLQLCGAHLRRGQELVVGTETPMAGISLLCVGVNP